jgi:hypothetical protein
MRRLNLWKQMALVLMLSACAPIMPVVQCTSTLISTQVPVTDGVGSEWRTSLLLHEHTVRAGTVLSIHTEGQVRNNLGYNVEVVELLEVRRSVQQDCLGGVSVNCTGGIWHPVSLGTEQPRNINDAIITGENLSPTQHYRKLSMSDTFVATIDEAVLFIAARTRSRSDSATMPPGYLDILPGQWKMCVQRTSP